MYIEIYTHITPLLCYNIRPHTQICASQNMRPPPRIPYQNHGVRSPIAKESRTRPTVASSSDLLSSFTPHPSIKGRSPNAANLGAEDRSFNRRGVGRFRTRPPLPISVCSKMRISSGEEEKSGPLLISLSLSLLLAADADDAGTRPVPGRMITGAIPQRLCVSSATSSRIRRIRNRRRSIGFIGTT